MMLSVIAAVVGAAVAVVFLSPEVINPELD